jgi:hypothetical protein
MAEQQTTAAAPPAGTTRYILTWESINIQDSIKRFQKQKGKPQADIVGVTLVASYHVVGMPMGFAVIDVTDVSGLQSLILLWQDVLTIKIYPVIDDPTAFKVLGSVLGL